MTNWRRLWRVKVLSCYLLVIVGSWLALCLYGMIRTTSNPLYTVGMRVPFKTHQHRLFNDRPLVLLTLSYHAAPIYDLIEQLQPLGVQFIERGLDAYACQYFNTCRRHDPLKVCYYCHLPWQRQNGWQTLSVGCHIDNSYLILGLWLPLLLWLELVGLALWLVSEIALNKYPCECGTLVGMMRACTLMCMYNEHVLCTFWWL